MVYFTNLYGIAYKIIINVMVQSHTLSDCESEHEIFFWCFASPNGNSFTEINRYWTVIADDAFAVEIAQCERSLRSLQRLGTVALRCVVDVLFLCRTIFSVNSAVRRRVWVASVVQTNHFAGTGITAIPYMDPRPTTPRTRRTPHPRTTWRHIPSLASRVQQRAAPTTTDSRRH